MSGPYDRFDLRLAKDEADVIAAQRLRYRVFVEELRGDGPLVDHDRRLERDVHDPFYDHLILVDRTRSVADLDHVVGVYRLLRGDGAGGPQRFYSEDEYDLARLKLSRRRLLELGRTCVHPDYRDGSALYWLWQGLAEFALRHGIEILFGVASFHGTDVDALAEPLSLLHHRHLAPEDLRVRARPGHYQRMDLIPEHLIDRRRATLAIPALIKGYLRLGGFVGDGAFVDHAFNTTDVCLVLDVTRMNARQKAIYTRGVPA